MSYRPGTTEDDFVELRDAILEFARAAGGPFSMNDLGIYLLNGPVAPNAGSYAAAANDLVELGRLRRLADGGGAHRFEIADDQRHERG